MELSIHAYNDISIVNNILSICFFRCVIISYSGWDVTNSYNRHALLLCIEKRTIKCISILNICYIN